jgi:nucleotide-binding universal stress UspA family protein
MRGTLKIKLILCPIDFSEFSVTAYQHALSVAEHYQAKLVAQHIVELWRHPSADFAASAGLYEEFCQALRESGKEQLQEFVKKHTHDEIQPEGVPSPAKTEEAMAAAAERLDKLIPLEGRKTLKIKTAVRIGKPYAQIIQLALETQIDLVTMGVRGRGALDVAVFGSTTYRVMQLGSFPVLAVRS